MKIDNIIDDVIMDDIIIDIVSEEELKDLIIDFGWCIGLIACGERQE